MQTFSLNEIIEMAVQIEKSGYTFYNRAIERKDLDDDSRALITYLRDEEINHEKTFLAMRTEIDEEMMDASTDWDMVSNYMRAITDSRIFSTPDSAIDAAVNARDFREVLSHAISFEKDTLLFFHAIHSGVNDERTKDVIRRIINEEVTHVMKLNEFRSKMS